MSGVPTDTLRYALDPRSVAIVGASENPDKIGVSRGHVSRRPVCGERERVRRDWGRLMSFFGRGLGR